mgnify:FL=1
MIAKYLKPLISVFFTLFFLSFLNNNAEATNISKERRVYYLDATYSMITPSKLWNPVRNDLAKAINAIEDETTEVYVIAFGGNGGTELMTWHDYATASGKERIIKGFQSFTPKTNTMTYLDRPLNDFYSNRVATDKVNYCFLMTDGRDENQSTSVFPNVLKQWGRKYRNSNVYGFYVMLNNDARDKNIESIIDKQDHLWKVETANVNINLIRLENHAVFNVRNDESIEIPISGKSEGLNFCASLPENSGLKVKNCEVKGGKLIVGIDITGDKYSMPASATRNLDISVSNAGKFDFLVSDRISVQFNNKKELVLFTPTERQKMGKVFHYDDFFFVHGKTVPIIHEMEFSFNDDAKAAKNAFAEFAFVDNNGQSISPKDMIITVDGNTLQNNRFFVTPSQNKITIEISFSSDARRGKYQGYLRLVSHNLHRLNNNECIGQFADAFQWTIYNNKTMNPLEKVLIWMGILVTSALLLWFIVIKPIKYPRFSKFKKTVLIKKNEVIIAQFTCNFKGARRVIFAAKKQKQNALNKLFTGRIDTIVNPIFEEPLSFIPRTTRKAMVKGRGYQANPNPISQSGVAEISAPARRLIINLQ